MSELAVSMEEDGLAERFRSVRDFSARLCEPLTAEDHGLQACPEVSPPRWHLAHTTWFFETFILKQAMPDYRPFDPAFEYLFNSYYNGIGRQYPRPDRHLLSRPDLPTVWRWRRQVDEAIETLLARGTDAGTRALVELGTHHEQQHQELILTDLKYSFSFNPLHPVYQTADGETPAPGDMAWVDFEGGLVEVGHSGDGFCFDNETPRHRVWLESYRLASRPVSAGEFMAFIADGGYRDAALWLADGWAWLQENNIELPLYWREDSGDYHHYTLRGLEKVDPNAPMCHLNYYEADAFARWSGARLPTEAEWEHAAAGEPLQGHFAQDRRWHPGGKASDSPLSRLFGDVWEWTASAYHPYPGFHPASGAVGEYNGKFMCNQMVLRGGSCATPSDHIRRTYRNFFYPSMRWQFSGLRLADDAR